MNIKNSILIFVCSLFLSLTSNVHASDNGVRVSIGTLFNGSEANIGEIGYEYKSWEASAALVEEADTINGYQDQFEIYSFSYITKPEWEVYNADPFFRLGVSHNSGSELVGHSNFRLGVGAEINDSFRIEWSHHSSAGIHPINTGIDYIIISYKLPSLF